MCLAQGPQHSDAGEELRSQVKHSTTEPLPSLLKTMSFFVYMYVNEIFNINKLPKINVNLQLFTKEGSDWGFIYEGKNTTEQHL